ncbi:hypothetical protein M231_05887 [Tremella mesenterica]|uniref:Uncharacterized protein n=1 Tax=Tremella mesenterica TaxID=5217 RepID=A0A4V1M3H2_TREME|nr:hypothetical protein M231_05887 [Tremella mesenterica]
MITPTPFRTGQLPVQAAYTLAPANANHFFGEMINLGHEPITLRPQEIIGTCRPLNPSTTVLANTVTPISNNEDVAIFRKVLRDMDINPDLSPTQHKQVEDLLIKHRHAFINL